MLDKIYEIICDDGVCSECKKYSGKFDHIPTHIPPFHPNCKCKIIEVEEILEETFEFLKNFEEEKSNVYTDTKGYVTVGCGSMFNNVKEFKKLPLYYENRLATTEEKEAEFYRLNGKRNQNSAFILDKVEAKILALEHLKGDLKSVRKKFEDFDNLPKNAKLVILDMEYNMGSNKFSKNNWPMFFEAIKLKDWKTAGIESQSKDIQQLRNFWRKNILQSIK